MTSVKKKGLPQGASIAIVLLLLLAVAGGGYFLLVRPQKAKAKSVQAEIDSTRAKIAQYRSEAGAAAKVPPIRIADIFRLTKAMPDQTDMPGLLLQLTQVARQSGIAFNSITPQSSVALTGYQVVPIELVFEGNYYELSDFLYRLRNLVDVRRGRLQADGRLVAVDSIDFSEGEAKFPQIKATLIVSAFVYGTGTPASSTPPPASTGSTSMSTDTAASTTTETSSAPASTVPAASGAAAAGAAG